MKFGKHPPKIELRSRLVTSGNVWIIPNISISGGFWCNLVQSGALRWTGRPLRCSVFRFFKILCLSVVKKSKFAWRAPKRHDKNVKTRQNTPKRDTLLKYRSSFARSSRGDEALKQFVLIRANSRQTLCILCPLLRLKIRYPWSFVRFQIFRMSASQLLIC